MANFHETIGFEFLRGIFVNTREIVLDFYCLSVCVCVCAVFAALCLSPSKMLVLDVESSRNSSQ